jgi:hypothetical protein
MDKSLEDNVFLEAGDDINVTEIMDNIKQKISEKIDSGVLKQREIDEMEEMELLPLPDFLDIPNVYKPHLYPGSDTAFQANTQDDEKNKFTDYVVFTPESELGFKKKILGKIRKIFFPLIRFMSRPIYNELKNIIVDLHNANKKFAFNNKRKFDTLSSLITITNQSKEYIKLLHNTINNIIVENTKMRIEDELLKTRIKVLEDKLEFLENRERALEKKVYK